MKKFTYLIALLALTACSNDDNEIQIDNRTPITFSATTGTEVVATPMTKALTQPTTTAFSSETRILMRIKSEDGSSSPTNPKYTRTVATAAGSESGTVSKSNVSFGDNDKRYWDDAHGRSSQLSVFAVAIENKNDASLLPVTKLNNSSSTSTWFEETSEIETIDWDVETTQTTTTLVNDNLVYSNNISTGGSGGVIQSNGITSNGKMTFEVDNTGTGHGTFNKGHMIFNHALTKITVNLTAGTGFSSGFTDVTDAIVGTVKNAPYSGTLDLATGKWNDSPSTNDVKMATENDKISHTALILPGTAITDGSTTDIIDFDINGNVYHITSDMIWKGIIEGDRNEALGVENNGTSGNFLQGKHYIINATFGKTAIESVSASVVGWSVVEVQNVNPTNAYITLSLYNPSGDACNNFALYRYCQESTSVETPGSSNPDNLTDWSHKYEGPATLSQIGEANKYSTTWYFESNKSFYHFRTVNKYEAVSGETTSTFTIQSGFNDNDLAKPYDPHWGAPMIENATLAYSETEGFKSSLHSAIGATTSEIKITELHMLSNVIVKLTTSNDDSKVELTDAKVELLNAAKEASVDMGSGLITPASSYESTFEIKKKTDETNAFFCPIVPQALNRGDGVSNKVGIKITTTDGNVYHVGDISEYTTTTENTTTKVNRWYPNHQYTYTFNLLKTGINIVTCTVTNWQDVNVNGGNVTIE